MIEAVLRRWRRLLLLALFSIAALAAVVLPGSAAAAGTGTISGTVTDVNGAVSGVVVYVEDPSGDLLYHATTGADGTYAITGIPDGIYWVNFSVTTGDDADQFYGATPSSAGADDESNGTAVAVSAADTATVNQSLAAGGELAGTITDAATGDPLEGEVVLVQSGEQVLENNTTASGAYDFTGLDTGSYSVYWEGGGTDAVTGDPADDASAWYGVSAPAESLALSTPISVAAGSSSPATANLALPTGATVTGTVTDSSGDPVNGAQIQLYDSAGNLAGGDFAEDYYTAGDGTYEVDNVLPGSYKVEFQPTDGNDGIINSGGNLAFQFYNNASSLSAAQTVTVTTGQTLPSIDATLTAGGNITGTVTGAVDGTGLAGVLVELVDANDDVLESADSNNDGSYTLAGIPAGSYHIEFNPLFFVFESTDDYQYQFYGDSQTLDGSTAVPVTLGSTTSGIDAVLSTTTTPRQTTTVTNTVTNTITTPVPAVVPTVTASTPTISGTAKVGDTLTAETPGWTSGTSFSYQWYAAGKAITGATASTFPLTGADYHKAITVLVTGKLSGYNWVTETSAESEAVAAGTLKAVVPKVTGTGKVGDKLTAKPGAWTTGTTFSYQWYAAGKAIKGATKSTFKLASAEKTKAVTVEVTGKLTGYTSATKTSTGTKKVVA